MTPEIEKGLRAARAMLQEPPQMRHEMEQVIVVQPDGSVHIDYAANPFLGEGIKIPYLNSAHARLKEISDIDARLAGGAL